MRVLPRTLRGQVALVIAGCTSVPFVGLLMGFAEQLGRASYSLYASVAILCGALLSVLLICLLVGMLMARHVTGPLTSLAVDLRSARARRGATVAQLSIEASDPVEVQDLKRSVNDILLRVEEEVRQRQAVLAMVAHDMKNPLLGTVRVLEQAQKHRAIETDWLDDVLQEQRRLLQSVTMLVHAARYERGDVAFSRRAVEMRHVVDRVVARRARTERVALSVRGEGTVWGDPEQIERAIDNLVDNAVRYARSSVQIDIYPGVVRVQDDGPGLPKELAELASPFRSESLMVDGVVMPTGMAGLGLYIVRRIVEEHGGRLVVESTNGSGTTMLAYLPE